MGATPKSRQEECGIYPHICCATLRSCDSRRVSLYDGTAPSCCEADIARHANERRNGEAGVSNLFARSVRRDRDWLALLTTSDYLGPVKFLRVLTLICFSFGLFVQVAAQAAVPMEEPAGMADCAEMAQGMSQQMSDAMTLAEDEGPCSEMSLECLVAMNCVPPLTLPGDSATDAGQISPSQSFLPAGINRLESEPLMPESPPPQIILTV